MVFVRSVLSPSSKDLNLVNLKWHLRTDRGDTDIGRGYSMKHGGWGGWPLHYIERNLILAWCNLKSLNAKVKKMGLE